MSTSSNCHPPIAWSSRATRSENQPIGKLMAEALKHPHLISLAAGFVDNATLPVSETQAAMNQLAEDPALLRKALQYDSSAGNAELRQEIIRFSYREFDSFIPDADRVVLTAGSNQLLHLLADCTLEEGDIVLAAAPTYFVFMGTLKSMGVRVIGVPADEDGIQIDQLAQQLSDLADDGLADRVKAIYTVTDFDNPAGSTLSLDRRYELLDLVRQWRDEHSPLLVWSDNAYSELRFEGEGLPPLLTLADDAREFTIEAGTFSKSFSPGIRVGWGVLPEQMVPSVLAMKSGIDFGSPHFSQVLMTSVLKSGALLQHLPVIREAYRKKRDATLAALSKELGDVDGVSWRTPKGGLYVWLQLPEGLDSSETGPLWKAATEAGVLYVPGHHCHASEGCSSGENTIRLSYGVLDQEGLAEGVSRLAQAIKSCLAKG